MAGPLSLAFSGGKVGGSLGGFWYRKKEFRSLERHIKAGGVRHERACHAGGRKFEYKLQGVLPTS